jgi:hypothetical protein
VLKLINLAHQNPIIVPIESLCRRENRVYLPRVVGEDGLRLKGRDITIGVGLRIARQGIQVTSINVFLNSIELLSGDTVGDKSGL